MRSVLLFSLMAVLSAAPAPPERVRVTTPSGAVLAGQFFDAGAGAPGVLFFPMCRPDAMDGWVPVAEHLRAAGVSSLVVSHRGYGGSTSQGSGDQRAADADASLAFLRSRTGAGAGLGVAGSSCGVWLALSTAIGHPEQIRAVVALTGPHSEAQVDFIRTAPQLAVFSGSAEGDGPAPDWARALKAASANSTSRIAFAPGRAHGTDIFQDNPAFARDIAEWLAAQLRAPARGAAGR
jgi:alpha/beta superfamily hydrolase